MEWAPVNITFKEFKKRGLLKAGIVIDFGDEKALVGNINDMGGTCNDCPVEAGRIVKAYSEVINMNEIK